MSALAKINYKSLIILLFMLGGLSSRGQFVDGYGILDHWYLSVNTGITSFIGDLSQYDYDPFNKLNHETDFSLSAYMGKEISPVLGCKGQLIYGSLKGEKRNSSFETSFLESTAIMTVNITKLFFDFYKESKYNFYAYGGLGMIHYRSVQRDINTNKFINAEGFDDEIKPVSPAAGSVLVFGSIMRMKINERLELNVEGSIHFSNSDKLDAQAGGSMKYDMFTYISAGVTYKIIKLYPMWRPNMTAKHKASRRHWKRNQSIFTHRKKGVRNLGNTFAVLRY